MRTIQTCGSSNPDEDEYSLTIGFEKQSITLDGLSKDDMLELKSCIDCMLFEEENDGIGTTS
jgi:hypothetical protein